MTQPDVFAFIQLIAEQFGGTTVVNQKQKLVYVSLAREKLDSFNVLTSVVLPDGYRIEYSGKIPVLRRENAFMESHQERESDANDSLKGSICRLLQTPYNYRIVRWSSGTNLLLSPTQTSEGIQMQRVRGVRDFPVKGELTFCVEADLFH